MNGNSAGGFTGTDPVKESQTRHLLKHLWAVTSVAHLYSIKTDKPKPTHTQNRSTAWVRTETRTQTDLITFAQACKCNVLRGGNDSLHIWFKKMYCSDLSEHFYCRGNIQLFHQSSICAADLRQASLNAVSPLTPHCTSHLVFPQSVKERGWFLCS